MIHIWPQISILTMFGLMLLREITGIKLVKYSNFFLELVYIIVYITLLYFGGFWNVLRAPQIIMMIFFILYLLLKSSVHGEMIQSTGILYTIFAIFLDCLILYWGGFFDPLIKYFFDNPTFFENIFWIR